MHSKLVLPAPPVRLGSSLVLACLVLACGACNSTADDGPIAEVVEVAFDQPLGPQRASVWTVDARSASGSGFESCFALSHEDGLFFKTSAYLLEKRGHGPLTDPALWSVPASTLVQCPVMHAMPDGGVVLVGGAYANTTPDTVPITRLGSDGAALWTHPIADHDPVGLRNEVASVPLRAGGVAYSYAQYDGNSALGPEFVVRLGDDGKEVWRTEIPKIHVDSADAPGSPQGTASPGVGVPTVLALTESSDGGLFLAGRYWFFRGIDCGSLSNPQTPRPGGTVCGSSSRNGLVGRLDASGRLLWMRRLGNAYAGGTLALEFAASLTDDSVLATGWIIPEKEGADLLHQQALAARYDGAGGLQWAKAFAFGPAPGPSFFAQSKSYVAVAREGGTADVVLKAPKGSPCRLLRFEPSGAISRVQILGEGGPGDCRPQALGPDLAYLASPSTTESFIWKLAP